MSFAGWSKSARRIFYEPRFDDAAKEETATREEEEGIISDLPLCPNGQKEGKGSINELGGSRAEFPFHYARDSIRERGISERGVWKKGHDTF